MNVDSVGGDTGLLANVIDRLQWYVKDPFIIQTDNAAALESALKIYRGTAGVVLNDRSDDEIRKVAEKYGGVIISGQLQVKSQEYFPACSAANLICGGIITLLI